VVLEKMDSWLEELAKSRVALAELDKKRVVFDHYKDKVTGLQEDKRKNQLKGKVPDKSAEEKLARNTDKAKEVRSWSTRVRAPLWPHTAHSYSLLRPPLSPLLLCSAG
jgi:hypothetical protein